ncbi:unnamed protein product, partial [Clonostachys byssicola]
IRFHQKSKTGCSGCKSRRVKANWAGQCDETKPRCNACTRRGIDCLYDAGRGQSRRRAEHEPDPSVEAQCSETRQQQQQPMVQQMDEGPHYSAKQLLDLRLMHHYSVSTCEDLASAFPDGVLRPLRVDAPQLALQHDFFLDALLLVAMVHLGSTDPSSLASLPVYLYRDQALRALRRAVATITEASLDAVRGASVLLATTSFATDRLTSQPGLWIANWMTLALGQRNFRVSYRPAASSPEDDDGNSPSGLYGSFTDGLGVPVIPPDIQRAIAKCDGDAATSAVYTAARELGRLIALVDGGYEPLFLLKKIKGWSFDVIPARFLDLVRQENPAALVTVAYYILLFKVFPDSWIYQGLVSHDIELISRTIDPAWEVYLAVPKKGVHVKEPAELAELLVGSLVDNDSNDQGEDSGD